MLAAVALAGCRSILGIDDPIRGGDDDLPPDGVPGVPAVFSTERITPSFCSGGLPGDPTCPINHVPLPNPLGARLDFVVQPLGDDLYLTNIQLVAGPTGLYAEHPWFVVWPFGPDVSIPDPLDRYFGLSFNLPPGDAGSLDAAVVTLPPHVAGAIAFSATFDALGEYAPPPP